MCNVRPASAQGHHRFGLWGKLILAILIAGTVPIVVGLSAVYIQGRTELKKVIGESFLALAQDSALKVDAELQRVIAADRLLATQAASESSVLRALKVPQTGPGAVTRLAWPGPGQTERGNWDIRGSWITGSIGKRSAGNGVEIPMNQHRRPTVRVSGLLLGRESGHFLMSISIPIQRDEDQTPVGWLHRDYDIKQLFDPLIYPIRFGETGHVMLIDNAGTIVSCPLLVTGSRILDKMLIAQVAKERAGWVTAESDGHRGQKFSLIGHAPLSGVNKFLPPDISWHMFVWQDSSEIFAPAKSLLHGVALAGVLAILLLGILGYYASRQIVNPIRQLRQEADHIASGDLNRKLDIRTGDDIEDLAGQFNEMRLQLRQLIGGLEEKVEERTQALMDTQAEKDKVVEQLIQTEKVSAIGTMASGIGHEINNPLYAILGLGEALRDEEDVSQCREYGEDIVKYSKHIGEIVKNLSGYIRPAAGHELEQVDVNESLTEAVAMAKRSPMSDTITIREDLSPLPGIAAKQEEIQQAFFNIIRNGIQAMRGKGTLDIESRQDGNRVHIRIRDQGPGIPEEYLGKVFDPFFTTKGPDEGEGLGLYIVQQIINKYDGTIAVESQTGKGTVFNISFPVGEDNR